MADLLSKVCHLTIFRQYSNRFRVAIEILANWDCFLTLSKSAAKEKRQRLRCRYVLVIIGGPSGARTPNLLIKSQLLYQLS